MAAHTIAFIGAGNMARSLIGGLLSDGYDPNRIWVACPTEQKLQELSSRFGVQTTQDNITAASSADVIVLAVKPQTIQTVVEEIKSVVQEQKTLMISIAAGMRVEKIQQWLETESPIVRCMPNTPALLRAGATALYANDQVSQQQKDISESIMRSVGVTVWLEDEADLDTVTALSGSGPAYFFLVIEAMQDAAEQLGLSSQDAKLLTLQTALGAARMALESDQDASVLREQVTSKGGTTEAALNVFKDGDLNHLFYQAIDAAKQRAAQLSE